MSYSNSICRNCEKQTYVNLENFGYLCSDCLKKINEPIVQNPQEDLVVKKSVRWLQSWLYIENLTTTSIVISWLKPQFSSLQQPTIGQYYVYSKCGRIQELINGNLTQVICENIDKDSIYEISINALIGNTPINAQLNKTFYNR